MDIVPHFAHCTVYTGEVADKAEVFAPYDRSLIATVDRLDAEAVEKVLQAASELFADRAQWLPKEKRIAVLMRAAEILEERGEMFAAVAAREGGKPLIDSRVEVARAVDGLRNCAELLRSESGTEIPMGVTAATTGRLAFTHREPIGVIAAVSAFNHPLNLIVHQVGPAFAAGCPVIVKPAEDTPLTCLRIVELLHEAGAPTAWIQALLTDSHETSEKLVSDSRVAFFSFIGSGKVGWYLRSRLAPGTRCALEHGGAAPVVVDATADLDTAIPALAKGGFYHAGQVCVSVQRVFAEASIARNLAERLAGEAGKMKTGDPTDADSDIGPLIRPAEVERVHTWVSAAIDAGAECLTGGKPISETCYEPTVLYDPPAHLDVSCKEIFGPVVCVYPYSDPEEAVKQANSLPYAFQAAVFSKEIDFALGMANRLDASAVMINDHTAFRADWMPFAGLRESGLGVGGIPHSYRDMTVEKMVVMRSPGLDS